MSRAAGLPRSLAAVFAGYAIVALGPRGVAAAFPAAGLFWFTSAFILLAIAAGFVTALLAGHHEIPHAAALGFLLISTAVISIYRAAAAQPGWSELTIAGCGPIATMLGASLRILTKHR